MNNKHDELHNKNDASDMRPKIQVYLSFIGDVNMPFDEITSIIGEHPTNTKEIESFKAKNYGFRRWSLSTGYIKAINVSEVFELLLDKLSDKEQKIIKAIHDYFLNVSFMVVISFYGGFNGDHRPIIELSRRCVGFAANIGAEIQFDIYNYYHDDP